MDLSINKKRIGNGILNVNNFSQALERAMVNKKIKVDLSKIYENYFFKK